MNSFWLYVLVIAVTWLPIGYISARILNAREGMLINAIVDSYPGSLPQYFDWRKPSPNTNSFGVGVLLGWITFLLVMLIALYLDVFATVLASLCIGFVQLIKLLGKLAPKGSTKKEIPYGD